MALSRTAISLLLAVMAVTAVIAEVAEQCDEEACQLPNCRCSSTDIPNGMEAEMIPHFVVLSFDDAVTISNYQLYTELAQKKNPNDCNIRMTFFTSHENTDYTLVNELHRNGHEVAVHSVTHKSDVQNYWRVLTKDGWQDEIAQQKEMLNIYGKIDPNDIKGFRAPFLEVGGNNMYQALTDAGFEYDCSWPSLQYTPWFLQPNNEVLGALWPYTLDYASIQDQTVGTKPSNAFPGMWVSPMTDLRDNREIECSMLDGCQSAEDELETSAAAVEDLLKRNFKSHFNSRTPFGVYVHESWFIYESRKQGFLQFLEYLTAFPEVYVVTVNQLIEWMKNPVPLADLGSLDAFTCGDLPATTCPVANHVNCNYSTPLPIDQSEVFIKMCEGPCPANYPYLKNVDGDLPYPLPEQ